MVFLRMEHAASKVLGVRPCERRSFVSTNLEEVVDVLDPPRDRLWSVVNDLESYPRFVREIAWARRTSHAEAGVGSRYEVRFSIDQGPVARHDVDVLVHRPPEHVVLVSDRWPGGHVSIRLLPRGPRRTEVQLAIALPERSRLPESWLRKRARRALALVDDHLARRPLTISRGGLDQAATTQSQLGVARILSRAGVISAGRPDRVARQLTALSKWGATVAGGYSAATARVPNEDAFTDDLG